MSKTANQQSQARLSLSMCYSSSKTTQDTQHSNEWNGHILDSKQMLRHTSISNMRQKSNALSKPISNKHVNQPEAAGSHSN